MDNATRSPSLLTWSFGTFHASFFLISLVALLYERGILADLLGSLNTLLGFALFGALWFITWWSTRRALRIFLVRANVGGDQVILRQEMVSKPSYGLLLVQGALWGGVSGVLFLLILLSLLAAAAIANTIREPASPASFGILLVVGLGGGVIAFLIGSAAGLILALIDSLVLALSRSILSQLPRSDT